jgi:hypothetical protein
MTDDPQITEFVAAVVLTARDFTPRDTVELGVIHGLCLDAANDHAPHMLRFLASVDGLEALASVLNQMPQIIVAVDVSGASWQFVREPELIVTETGTSG